jgi:hypothetical protein
VKTGYLGLFRKFFDEHEFWKEKRKYSKAEAWIDLMQSARYGEEPETLFDKRGSYILEYGDVYISLRYLGERWQWSKNKVQHFLEYLRKRESITFKKRDSHRTIIHIVNLKGYTEWIKGKRDSEGTVKGQSRDSEGTKKKKVNKEKKDNNIKIKRFVPPKLDEVKAYCLERQNSVDPNKWIDHYESNGWMVGKNKMKSWKAAIRTWESNDLNNAKKSKFNNLSRKDYTQGVNPDGTF